MYKLFEPVRSLLKVENVRIDNDIFRLHYKATVILLVTASLLVTSKQYFGDPIGCIVDGVPQKVMDTYCWIHSTFTLPDFKGGPHPGVGTPDSDGYQIKYHKYYQWVCFVLYIQAASFYFPRYLWKNMEGGKIKMLVQQLKDPIHADGCKEKQIEQFVRYWRLHRGTHALYAYKFVFCEFLNLANVLAQIYFTDYFLGNEFRNYGLEVIFLSMKDQQERSDPLSRIFPKVTKCTFHKYGPSGTVENKDGLCVLPLNIINEKIYIFLWFWLIGLAGITGLYFLYRALVVLGSHIRIGLIKSHAGHSVKRSHVRAILEADGYNAIEKFGDWFVLQLVVANVDMLTTNQLLQQIYKEEAGTVCDSAETLRIKTPA